DEQEVGQNEAVRPLRLVFVLDRVRERRPGEPEGGEQKQRRGGDPDADRIVADLGLALELGDEEAVAESQRPERELRRDEWQPEPVHLAEEAPVELQPELVAAIPEQNEVDGEGADPVADDYPERALVEVDDEDDRRADRDEQVGERREREENRPLLDAEEGCQLLVVHLSPEPDEGGANQPGLAVPERERIGDGLRRDPARSEAERRAAHREPERRPHDADAMLQLWRVEVVAEEG